jgi:hypothetical protein
MLDRDLSISLVEVVFVEDERVWRQSIAKKASECGLARARGAGECNKESARGRHCVED